MFSLRTRIRNDGDRGYRFIFQSIEIYIFTEFYFTYSISFPISIEIFYSPPFRELFIIFFFNNIRVTPIQVLFQTR